MKVARYRRKKIFCLNCNHKLSENENYCKNCGQENNDKKVSVKILLRDFYFDYFNIDSKAVRTIKSLILKPGELTLAYNSGKRMSFISPAKLYFYVSVFYFFVLSTFHGNFLSDSNINFNPKDSSAFEIDVAASPNGSDTVSKKMKLPELIKQTKDSLNRNETFKHQILTQLEKIVEADREQLGKYFINSISTMMFVMLPLFAAIVMLFHFRRKMFYIEHLIYGLHLHSLLFFCFGIYILLNAMVLNVPILIPLVVVVGYAILSMRKVYNHSIVTSIFRLLGIGSLYFFIALVGFFGTILLSFILY